MATARFTRIFFGKQIEIILMQEEGPNDPNGQNVFNATRCNLKGAFVKA
jgi:hypothetical protein